MSTNSQDPDAITFDVAATLEDQVKFSEYLLTQPEARRQRAIRWVLGLLVYPVVGLGIGFCFGTLASGETPTPSRALTMLKEDPWTSFLLPWMVLAGTLGVTFVVLRILQRPLIRMRLRRLLKERAGIDLADPHLTERVRCTFGRDGYRVESQGYTHLAPWVGIKAVQETSDLLLVMTSVWYGYVIPKRDIPPHDLVSVRALAARQLDPRPGPWGGAA